MKNRFNNSINNEPSTEEEFLEIKSKYNLSNLRFRTPEEVQAETQIILAMTVDDIDLMAKVHDIK